MINLKDIQARLREEIKSSNLTQKEIAEKLGINPSTVSKYVRLDKFPAIDTFANLCEILDVSSDEILGLKKKIRKKAAAGILIPAAAFLIS